MTNEHILPKSGYAILGVMALICGPTMAAHVQTSPAHAGTRQAFHVLHESIITDGLRLIRQMESECPKRRCREGDKK